MYAKDSWYLINHIEHEYKYPGRYGARGEKRKKKKKATPGQVAKQNQYNREVRCRRLLRNNFYPGDYWVTLKNKSGARKNMEEFVKDMRKFLREMRKEYKARGGTLKFIYRLEIGKRGGLHAHIVINRMPGDAYTDLIIRDAWRKVTPDGSVDYTTIREQGGGKDLAAYITKQAGEEIAGQMRLFSKKDQKKLIRISSSRNLDRAEPVRKVYRHWTMKKVLENGPKPTPGYYIDKDSIRAGTNCFTGFSYYKYTEVRIDQIDCRRRGDPGGGHG